MRFDLPKPPEPGALALGDPLYGRIGQATGNVKVATADLRFRRTERIVVELNATLKPDSVSAELLDRTGKLIPLPAKAGTGEGNGVIWLSAEFALAPLAPGDYVIRVTATKGSETRQMLAPFKIVP